MTFDGKAFGLEIVTAVKAHISDVMTPVVLRLEAVEHKLSSLPELDADDVAARAAELILPQVKDVRAALDALPPVETIVAGLVSSEVEKAVSAIEKPHDGHSPSPEELEPLIAEHVSRAVAALPVPKDGEKGEPGEPVDPAMLSEMVSLAVDAAVSKLELPKGEKGDPGEPGQSVDIMDVGDLIVSAVALEVEKAVAQLEPPKGEKGEPGERGEKGDAVDIKELTDIIETVVESAVSGLELPRGEKGEPGEKGEKGDAGKDGRDGLDVVELMEGKDGHLIATMSDGRVRDIGPYKGKDGRDGVDGKDGKDGADAAPADVDLDTIARMIEDAHAKHTPPEPEEEFLPDELAERVALAVKTLASYEGKSARWEQPNQWAPSAPFTLNMPPINVSIPEQQPPVIHMAAPVVNFEPPTINVAPAEVTVEMPKKGKEVTRVTEWDDKGRIKAFEKSEEPE